MEERKININASQGISELILREGTAVKKLDPKEPIKIDIKGTIHAPYIFLMKRYDVVSDIRADFTGNMQIDLTRTHVLIDRENVRISLIMNEADQYTTGKVVGSLETHPKLREFGINNAREWDPNELGQFIKMNKAYFSDKSENMDLVTKLKNFKATVNVAIDKIKDENGSFADNYSGIVDSNLPGVFKVNIPLFKGFPPEEIEVEFYASVNGRNFTLQLVSPGAQQAYDEVRDSIIDEQIKLIEELVPSVPIIEQ